MGRKIGRAARLTGLASALGLAAAVAGLILASGAAAPAFAGVSDSGGTATIHIRPAYLAALAKSGIVALPGGTGAATDVQSAENVTLQVSGGNATFIGTTGRLDLAGTLQLIDGLTGKSVTLTNLTFNYATSYLTANVGKQRVVIAEVGGAENGQQNPGPPETQTFTASGLFATYGGARYLNSALHASFFKPGQDFGGFATTYDIDATT